MIAEIRQQIKTKVYLAGGLKSNWQSKVIKSCGDKFTFYNPLLHGLDLDSKQYTTWDIFHVKQSDIIFAYMEATNPSGYGLSLEIGYAKALNKTVVLVNERATVDQNFDRHFKIVEHLSDITFNNLDEGITHLMRYC